jgi:glycosyltransferase involved in cell wall biosynthesis
MSIGLAMILLDEAATLPRTLLAVLPLVDHWTIVDTGSTDGTQDVATELLAGVPGELHERGWVDFGHNRTELLELACGTADWLLLLDADMTVEFHPGLREWLSGDPDPDTDAWMVRVEEHWGWYRLPLLIRGNQAWDYEGRTHEALDTTGKKRRSLLGLTVHHDPAHSLEKHERDLDLLRDDYKAGDPRATFYTAQAFRALGRTNQAIIAYEARAKMSGWEEEAWYAAYQAAKLSGDVDGLLEAFEQRPWRHEPLSAAARLVAQAESDDVLFHEEI